MATDSKVVCILGMHRSGTSMLAGWLNSCGLNVGDNLLQQDFSNPVGHFEDLDFLSLHKEILQLNGIDASGFQLTKTDFEVSEYHQLKMSHLIQLKCKLHPQWGWKDPRTCLFIDHYKLQIPDLKIISIHRPAQEVLQSLLKRDWNRWKNIMKQRSFLGMHPKLALQTYFKAKLTRDRLPLYVRACEIYFEKMLVALNLTSPENRIALTLAHFLKNDKELFDKINRAWNLELNYESLKKSYKNELLGGSPDMHFPITDKLKTLDAELQALAKNQ